MPAKVITTAKARGTLLISHRKRSFVVGLPANAVDDLTLVEGPIFMSQGPHEVCLEQFVKFT